MSLARKPISFKERQPMDAAGCGRGPQTDAGEYLVAHEINESCQ